MILSLETNGLLNEVRYAWNFICGSCLLKCVYNMGNFKLYLEHPNIDVLNRQGWCHWLKSQFADQEITLDP